MERGNFMKSKIIVLSVLCMLLLVGCTNDSSSEKDNSSKVTTTTTSKYDSFEATVLTIDDDGHILFIGSCTGLNCLKKDEEVRFEYDDSIEVPSDIKEGDRIKVTYVDYLIEETYPPRLVIDVISIEKIG